MVVVGGQEGFFATWSDVTKRHVLSFAHIFLVWRESRDCRKSFLQYGFFAHSAFANYCSFYCGDNLPTENAILPGARRSSHTPRIYMYASMTASI